ncbi:MAG: NUDIX hydrolase [Actinobacteria bacterium]|nr:NUDIX hydrolase [Actinomycetota bacterium]
MDLHWDVVASETVWRGRFQVVVDTLRAAHDGRELAYTYLGVRRGAVAVLALDADRQVICVRQYRHPVRQVTLEIPAGHMDHDEDPAATALREFEEETGLRLARVEPLGDYVPVPSLAGFTMHLYVGFDPAPGRQQLDGGEVLEVVCVPVRALYAQVLAGESQTAALNYALLLARAKGYLPELSDAAP